jgi:hypothetical protein
MVGTSSLVLVLEMRLGERVRRGFGIEVEEVVKGELMVVDASEGCLRSAERFAKEKVDASDWRIETLLLRRSGVGIAESKRGGERSEQRAERGKARKAR